MRSTSLFLILLLFISFFPNLMSQDYGLKCDMPEITETAPPLIQYKGKYITSTGTLRVLVVFIRFADDIETTAIWPDPNVKPEWVTNFVNSSYNASGSYYTGTVSNYFYQNSYGNLHVIGDVYYVTTTHDENYYHEYAGNNQPNGDQKARSLIEMDVLDKLDGPLYDVDFSVYDNWQYNGPYDTEPGQDGKLDMLWFITRNLHDNNYPTQKKFGIGWARLDCPTHDRDGVTINGGGFSTGTSGIGMFRDGLNKSINSFSPPYGSFSAVNLVAHEMTHYLFGLNHFAASPLDLIPGEKTTSCMLTYVGGWMGEYSGYEKWRLGWMTPVTITNNGDNYVLYDLASTPWHPAKKRLYKINIPGTDQFYLIENRSWVSIFEPRYTFDSGPYGLLKPGILIYHIISDRPEISSSTAIKFDADGRFKWKMLHHGSNNGFMWDDFIDKDYPDRFNGYSETERLFIDNYPSQSWFANWYPNQLTPFGGGAYITTYSNNGLYNTTDLTGDSLDIYDVGYVLSPWSNPSSLKWIGNGFTQTNIGIEIKSFNTANSTYTLAVRLSNPEELAPSKPYLGWDPRDLGRPYEAGWIYLAWGADFWDGGSIEPDYILSELQRKIGTGNWSTVYTGSNRLWSDGSLNYDPNGNTPVYFRVRWKDSQDKWSVWSDLWDTRMSNISSDIGVEKSVSDANSDKPTVYALSQNYPNPFNPSTKINYEIPKSGYVQLKIYDVMGREIVVLADEIKPEGYYSVNFDASNLPSGVYIYSLRVNDFIQNNKMTLLK